jgi:hypothetical protein
LKSGILKKFNSKSLGPMKKYIAFCIAFVLALSFQASAQSDKKILRKLKGDQIEWIGDGVFKLRHKKSKKWGMFQQYYGEEEITQMIPTNYDSIYFFHFNDPFMVVYNEGKLGIYLSRLSYYENSKETVACLYDEYIVYKRYLRGNTYPRERKYLAVSKNGKWGWVDWLTGEVKSEFVYDSFDDLPAPAYKQEVSFEE